MRVYEKFMGINEEACRTKLRNEHALSSNELLVHWSSIVLMFHGMAFNKYMLCILTSYPQSTGTFILIEKIEKFII